jgi:hypothetical protein
MSDISPSISTTLSEEQLRALRNLSRKHAGHQVGWIAISQAQALTGLGLAKRSASGWEITVRGEAALGLASEASLERKSASILSFVPAERAPIGRADA